MSKTTHMHLVWLTCVGGCETHNIHRNSATDKTRTIRTTMFGKCRGLGVRDAMDGKADERRRGKMGKRPKSGIGMGDVGFSETFVAGAVAVATATSVTSVVISWFLFSRSNI
jgi:hypothetical protein